MQEIWKDIKGYENLYQISNLGRIKSFPRIGTRTMKIRILKQTITKNGYYCVVLYKNRKPKTKSVHRLVAETFIPNPNNYNIVNHKDENSLNNNVNNLEWCTQKYNINYGTGNKRRSDTEKIKVNQYDLNGNFIKEWQGIIDVSKKLKISDGNIVACCKGKRKTAGGYKWEYKEDLKCKL